MSLWKKVGEAVAITLATAAALAIAGAIVAQIPGAWAHLCSASWAPNWLVYLLMLWTLLTLWRLGVHISESSRKNAESMSFTQYTEDNFNGVRWRWSYGSWRTPVGITPHCPQCDTELVAVPIRLYTAAPQFKLVCERCHCDCYSSMGKFENLVAAVNRQVERKIREIKQEARDRPS